MASRTSQKRPRVRRTYVIPFDDLHPDASPNTSDAEELYHTITQSSLFDSNDDEYRLDLYFLPGGSQDDCIAHYHAEKAARGTYQAQIDALVSGGGGGGGGKIPGLVDSYAAHDKAEFRYHGLLVICDVPDWRAGDQLLTRVEFDPLSQEDYEKFSKDPGDHREPDVLPAVEARPEALSESSPGFGRELPRPFFGVQALGIMFWHRVPRQRYGQEYWLEARDRGWTTW